MLLSTLSNSPGNSEDTILTMAYCNKPCVIILNPEISGTISVIIFKGDTLEIVIIHSIATYRNPIAKQQCWNEAIFNYN